jgi:hypothetical protein
VASRFEWDQWNADHIYERHHVHMEEAEQALLDAERAQVFGITQVLREKRKAVVGMTESGRYLVVIYTERGSAIRIVTARPATAGEVRLYRRGRGRSRQ